MTKEQSELIDHLKNETHAACERVQERMRDLKATLERLEGVLHWMKKDLRLLEQIRGYMKSLTPSDDTAPISHIIARDRLEA